MKIYFDESGQSGCVLLKDDLMNFQKQPTFAIGAVVVKDDNDCIILTKKYTDFLNRHHIEGEIKGSELLTRARNNELKDFMRNIADRTHFYVLLYDKRFYISTLLLLSLLGHEYQHSMPEHFYLQAGLLSLQDDDFFISYLKYIESPGVNEFQSYLNYLTKYSYSKWDCPDNAVVMIAQKILQDKLEDIYYDDFMTFGWYDNPKITNLVNLNALSELIYFIKSQNHIQNNDVAYIHDHIPQFEETFRSELQDLGIDISFADSQQEVLLQLADNMVSITRHSYDKAISHIKANEQWAVECEWDMNLHARVIRKLTAQHISFTVPIADWSAALCAEIMFDPRYPKTHRNNFYFNFYYQENIHRIMSSIISANRPLSEIMQLLEE